jgi:hypothetical protein
MSPISETGVAGEGHCYDAGNLLKYSEVFSSATLCNSQMFFFKGCSKSFWKLSSLLGGRNFVQSCHLSTRNTQQPHPHTARK